MSGYAKAICEDIMKQLIEEGTAPSITELGKRHHIFKLQKENGSKELIVDRDSVVAQTRLGMEDIQPFVDPCALELQAKLEAAFPCLNRAVVVRQPEGADPDSLYVRLGSTAARILRNGLIRDGDTIGVGSGRAVLHTAMASRDLRMCARGVSLASLTGISYSSAWNSGDENAQRFSAAFEGGEDRTILTRGSLAYGDPSSLERAWKQTWLSSTRRVHLGLVGVGTVNLKHRFWELAAKNQDPALEKLQAPLKSLMDLCAKHSSSLYSPVADVSNHAFFVPPPPELSMAAETEGEVRAAINEINSRMLCMKLAGLGEIDALFLIAGSTEKAFAIRELLRDPTLKVRYLCIDMDAAKALERIGLQKSSHATAP